MKLIQVNIYVSSRKLLILTFGKRTESLRFLFSWLLCFPFSRLEGLMTGLVVRLVVGPLIVPATGTSGIATGAVRVAGWLTAGVEAAAVVGAGAATTLTGSFGTSRSGDRSIPQSTRVSQYNIYLFVAQWLTLQLCFPLRLQERLRQLTMDTVIGDRWRKSGAINRCVGVPIGKAGRRNGWWYIILSDGAVALPLSLVATGETNRSARHWEMKTMLKCASVIYIFMAFS